MAGKNEHFLQLTAPTPASRVTVQHAGLDQKTMPPNKRHRNKHSVHTQTYETALEFRVGTTRSSKKGGWQRINELSPYVTRP